MRRLQIIYCLLMASMAIPAADAATQPKKHVVAKHTKPKTKPHHGVRGPISYMHPNLDGHRMADGHRFDATSNAAASMTLPLGSMAKVTNLRNGRSAVVKIGDRGPHSKTRIMDVSPATAKALGMIGAGVVLAEIEPLPRIQQHH